MLWPITVWLIQVFYFLASLIAVGVCLGFLGFVLVWTIVHIVSPIYEIFRRSPLRPRR